MLRSTFRPRPFRPTLRGALSFSLLAAMVACGSPVTGPGGDGSSGGAPAGGATGQGGSPITGGQSAVGGTTPAGGTGAGGAAPSGGSLASGGGSASGGWASGGAAPGGGGPSAGGASGGAASVDPCATGLCDDFEGDLSKWEIQKDSVPAPIIDATKGANGSSKSLKTTVTSQQSFAIAPVPAQSFYVRAYMNFSASTTAASSHSWFIVGADNTTSGAGAQMRFGASSNHGHPETDFNVYGSESCSGEKTHFSDGANDALQGWQNTTDEQLQFAADTWYCVELFFNGDGDEFQLWVDGTEHAGFHVTAENMCPNWSPEYQYVKIGGGGNGTFGDVWYDDVVISTQPIGCKK